ncbi:PLXB1-like protein, partial [Mya arenaria]
EVFHFVYKGGILWNLDSATSLHLDLQSKQLDGQSFKVVFYHCGSLIYPSNNCGQCESFKYFQPYLRCHWCSGQCIYSGKNCTSPETVCPDPVITKVYPLSAHINAITPITVEGYNLGSHTNETLNAVSVGNIPCYTIYTDVVEDISTQITCNLGPSQRVATEHVTVNIPGHEPVVFANYRFSIPRLIRISPNYGPLSGGTNVTIYGEYLDTGWERKIMVGEQLCRLVTVPAFMKPTMAECRTVKLNSTSKTTATVSMVFDNQAVEGVNFTYLPDPVVWDIQPRKSFESGGRVLTVIGLNLFSVHTQKLRAHTIDGKAAVEMSCGLGKAHGRVDSEFNGSLTCRSPMFPSRGSRRRINQSLEVLGIMEVSLVMDDVSSVRNLPSNISLLLYYPDPTFYKFTETQRYAPVLFIRGKHLDLAATAEDVQVLIGCEKCNVTTLQHDLVICNPPTSAPKCNITRQTLFAIKVSIGFLIQEVGHMEYKNSSKEHQVYINIQITGGVVVGGLFLIFVLSVIGFCVKTMKKLREQIQQEESSKEYELELLKASE